MSRAQQEPAGRRRTVTVGARMGLVALGLAVVLPVAACGSGQIAQTAGMSPAVNGAYGQTGRIAVRDASLAFPATGDVYRPGESVPLVLTIVNSGSLPDTLVSVTSPVSAPATLTGATSVPPRTALVAGADVVDRSSAPASPPVDTTTQLTPPSSSSGAPTTTGAPTAPDSSSSSGAPTTTGAPTSGVATGTPVTVGQITIVLQNLTTAVRPGQTVPVTLTFANAGQVVVEMPVAAPGDTPTADPTTTTAAPR